MGLPVAVRSWSVAAQTRTRVVDPTGKPTTMHVVNLAPLPSGGAFVWAGRLQPTVSAAR